MTAAAGTNNIAGFHATKGLAAHRRAAGKEPNRTGPNSVATARIAPSRPRNGSSNRTNGRASISTSRVQWREVPYPEESRPRICCHDPVSRASRSRTARVQESGSGSLSNAGVLCPLETMSTLDATTIAKSTYPAGARFPAAKSSFARFSHSSVRLGRDESSGLIFWAVIPVPFRACLAGRAWPRRIGLGRKRPGPLNSFLRLGGLLCAPGGPRHRLSTMTTVKNVLNRHE
jgi:hypothetical protein